MSSAAKNTFIENLLDVMGETASADPQICRSYDHDLGEMPKILLMLFKRVPIAVALPRTTDQVKNCLAIAWRHKVPVTPRAQASSGYGGAMPTKGGLLVDVSRMREILAIDKETLTCDVQPGVVWTDLEDALAKEDMACRIMPTSAPSSTVGGMFAMGGMGIGSYEYGNILDVVSEIEVIDPDGQQRLVKGRELAIYAFSQGALGIITRLRLKCRKKTDMAFAAIHLPSASDLPTLLDHLNALSPYSISVLSAEFCAMQAEAAKHPHAAPIRDGFLCHLAFENYPGDEALWQAAKAVQGSLLPEPIAKKEWEERFYPMRIKRHGPTLNVGEYLIDAAYFGDVCAEVRQGLKNDRVGFEAFVGKDQKVAVLVYIQDSSEDLLSLFRMGKAMLPLHVAAKYGGTVYATGLWFNSRTKDAIGPGRLRRMRERKLSVDPGHRMNPGKVCGGMRGFLPFALLSHGIWQGTRFMGPISGFLKAKPRKLPHHHED